MIDEDGSGIVDTLEVKNAFEKMHTGLSLNELKTREGINLANRLVLGVTWIDRDRVYQSESLAYHAILSQSRMEEATELEVLPLLGTPQIGPKQERFPSVPPTFKVQGIKSF